MIWRPQGPRQVSLSLPRASGRWAGEMRQPRSRASSERSGPGLAQDGSDPRRVRLVEGGHEGVPRPSGRGRDRLLHRVEDRGGSRCG